MGVSTMSKNRPWFLFLVAVCLLILAALACTFPAVVAIEEGLVPSAVDDGYATLDVSKAGCDCDTSIVSGKLKYTDGQGPNKVHFTGKIEHTLEPGCQVSEATNLWATGTYNPGPGIFSIGLYGPADPAYDTNKCGGCDPCWRLWLDGGEFDGYENWACTLENEDALTYEEHPPDSACATN